MMLQEIVDARHVLAGIKAKSKKQLLQDLSTAAAEALGLDQRQVFEMLLKREKLGSTGLGQGIAIPHAKLPALARVHGFFARLGQPIAFDALDGLPVDLVFLLLAPEHAGADHLKALACISRFLRDPIHVTKLRGTSDVQALYAILTEPPASRSASAA